MSTPKTQEAITREEELINKIKLNKEKMNSLQNKVCNKTYDIVIYLLEEINQLYLINVQYLKEISLLNNSERIINYLK